MSDHETEQAQRHATERPHLDLGKVRQISLGEYGIRFAFGFAVSVVAGIITKVAGARVGGLFLAFPAILPATLTLMEKKDGIAEAASDIRGAAIGATAMIAFAGVAALLIETHPAPALVLALVAWIVVSIGLYAGLQGLGRLLGVKHYLPEIPTSEAAPVADVLRRRGLTLGCAESATGGLLGSLFSQLPDAESFFRGSVVAYHGDLKRSLLHLPDGLVESEGTVSRAVAEAMARSACEVTGADIGVGVTGVFGHSIEGKPPGLTYIALCAPGGRIHSRELRGGGTPGRNDEDALRAALQLIGHVVKRDLPAGVMRAGGDGAR